MSRRQVLARIVGGAAVVGVVPALGSTPAGAATPRALTAGPTGVVKDVSGDGQEVITVQVDEAALAPQAARAAPAIGEEIEAQFGARGPRPGDRLAIERTASGGWLAVPLYFSVEGSVKSLSEERFDLDRWSFQLDEHSMVYETRDGRDPELHPALDYAPRLQGREVGVVAVDNEGGSLTVEALYVAA
jgi:hypothetical protein